MKAAVLKSYGSVPVYESFPEPVVGDGEEPITMTAAGLHPLVKSIAAGSHYLSGAPTPIVAGVDGVGRTADGRRYYVGGFRAPYGTMAERGVLGKLRVPVPETMSDVQCAAVVNPGISSWLALTQRANFVAGETVLVLGATGAAGSLSVQVAKLLGARRVIAIGREAHILERLNADETLLVDQPASDLRAAVVRALEKDGVDVVLDYLWGKPAETVIAALVASKARTRFVNIGELAGSAIALPAQALRGSAITFSGSGAGSVPMEMIGRLMPRFIAEFAPALSLAVDEVPLSEVSRAWDEDRAGKRVVFVP